ncbi:MAG: hypothetical protein ACYC3X_21470 [Pirellulaceae bacterium]
MLRSGVMGVDDGHHAGQRFFTQFAQQVIDVGGDPIDVKIRIHLAKPCGLDITDALRRIGQRHFVQTPSAYPRLKDKVSRFVGFCVAELRRLQAVRPIARDINLTVIMNLNISS